MNYRLSIAIKILIAVLIASLLVFIGYQLFDNWSFLTLAASISLTGLLFTILKIVPSTKKPNSDAVELKELIKLYLSKKKENPNFVKGWDTGAENDSVIEWITEGIGYDEIPMMPEAAMNREGKVKILFNDKPIDYVINNKKEHAPWNIILGGANVGIFQILIYSHLSKYIDADEVRVYLEKNFKLEFIDDLMPDIIGSGNNLYLIQHKKFHECLMELSWGCGSGGCSFSIMLYLKDGRESIQNSKSTY